MLDPVFSGTRFLVKLCYGKPPSPQSGLAESKISGKLQKKRQWPKRKNDQGSFHVHKSWYNVNIKIIVCKITGPAAAWSAGPVPTHVGRTPGTDDISAAETETPPASPGGDAVKNRNPSNDWFSRFCTICTTHRLSNMWQVHVLATSVVMDRI